VKVQQCKVCGGKAPKSKWKKGAWVRLNDMYELAVAEGATMVGRMRRCPPTGVGGLVHWFTGPWVTLVTPIGNGFKVGHTRIRRDQVWLATEEEVQIAREACRVCGGTGEEVVAQFLRYVEVS